MRCQLKNNSTFLCPSATDRQANSSMERHSPWDQEPISPSHPWSKTVRPDPETCLTCTHAKTPTWQTFCTFCTPSEALLLLLLKYYCNRLRFPLRDFLELLKSLEWRNCACIWTTQTHNIWHFNVITFNLIHSNHLFNPFLIISCFCQVHWTLLFMLKTSLIINVQNFSTALDPRASSSGAGFIFFQVKTMHFMN